MHFLSRVCLCAVIGLALSAQEPPPRAMGVGSDLAVLKRDTPTGFANAGWKYDRYQELPSLDAGQRMVVADLKGPGIIRHIHTTRHQNPDLNARGIVLEITFDDAGMPFIGKGAPAMLSIYRFHDHLPIRFARELTWSINWSQERGFTSRPEWAERVQAGGCWMDYATVFYWYQAEPAGYRHEPLPPLASRRVAMLHPNLDPANLDQVLRSTPLDPQLANRFDRREDLDRCRIVGP